MKQINDPRTRARGAFVRALLTVLLLQTAGVARPADGAAPPTPVDVLVAEALMRNPEIRIARLEHEAALQRRAPARSLDDPMLEIGIVNAALPLSLRRDDMTMQMLGITQKLPFPGKRGLREAIAVADATALSFTVGEVTNRVVRDVRVAYEDLRLAHRSAAATALSRDALRSAERSVLARYAVGRASQSDVLLAGTRIAQMEQELLKLDADRRIAESELRRLSGRDADTAPIVPSITDVAPNVSNAAADPSRRPQLAALHSMEERGTMELALAERDYYPDFEMRLGYGHRERSLEGMPRDDVITMTIAVNLPLWRKARLAPRVAEARALRARSASMAEAQRLDTIAALEQQQARAEQARLSLALYRTSLLPQTHAATQAAHASYEAGATDFATLLDATTREYAAAVSEAEVVATAGRAAAEIAFLSGTPATATASGAMP